MLADQSGSGMYIHASLTDEAASALDPAHKDSDAEPSGKLAKNSATPYDSEAKL